MKAHFHPVKTMEQKNHSFSRWGRKAIIFTFFIPKVGVTAHKRCQFFMVSRKSTKGYLRKNNYRTRLSRTGHIRVFVFGKRRYNTRAIHPYKTQSNREPLIEQFLFESVVAHLEQLSYRKKLNQNNKILQLLKTLTNITALVLWQQWLLCRVGIVLHVLCKNR